MPSISTENIHLGNSNAIAQYIKSISMNNRKTGIQYAARLRNFANYFSKTYNFTIDDLLINKTFKIDVYELLSNYAFYLTSEYVCSDGFKLSNITIKNKVNTIRNFLEYHDIDINPRKYKLKIRHPKVVRQEKYLAGTSLKILLLQTFHLFCSYCCVVVELRRFRIDDGTAEELVVLFPPDNVCVSSSTLLRDVGISINGVTP
jgi:hypothetical protein